MEYVAHFSQKSIGSNVFHVKPVAELRISCFFYSTRAGAHLFFYIRDKDVGVF